MPWILLREIVLDQHAQAELEVARRDFPRFDEAWDGLNWLLARNPTPTGSFPTTYKGQSYMMYGWSPHITGAPDMWIVYAYDDVQVVIHGINAIEPAEDLEEN